MYSNFENQKNLTDNNHEENFEDLFTKNLIYELPLFQRDYKWDNKQLTGVINDFQEIIDGLKEVHFFGAIIVHEADTKITEGKKLEILDGQQRITTIYLFILACVYVLRNLDMNKAKKLFELYLVNIHKDFENPTLVPNINDRAQLNWIFQNIITKPFDDTLDKAKYLKLACDENAKERGNLRTNYTRFKKFIEAMIVDVEDNTEKIDLIDKNLEKILRACRVVSIKIQQRHHGPLIFDNLNAKPVKMTISELVKNAICSKVNGDDISSTRNFFNTHWVPFEKGFNQGIKGLENYFFPYALISNPNTTKENAYRSMSDQWSIEKNIGANKIIEELSEYQPSYNALTTGKSSYYRSDLKNAIYSLNGARLPNTTLPFFMQVLKKAENNERFIPEAIKIFSTIETFLVRRQVCGDEPTGLHAVYKSLWKKLSESGEITAIRVFEHISNLPSQPCADDDEFLENLLKAPIGKKKIKRFLIESYDRSLKGESPDWDKKTQVEHVLPQNISNWAHFPNFSEESHSNCVHLFGNLVPLTGEFNNTVSNKPFKDKKEALMKNTMYKSTRELFEENNSWNPIDIEKRNKKLAEWALTRWQYLEK